MDTITVDSIPTVAGWEEDGRWWADIESMPGVMAYGATSRVGHCKQFERWRCAPPLIASNAASRIALS
jgi:hypothetical protein